MRLYHFTNEKYALDNIENRQLKVSFPNDVNDLFELKPFDFGTRENRLAWHSSIDKYSKNHGFISFAENWEAPTMWGHYADKHKGVCYGFDVPREMLCKINYMCKLRPFDKEALCNETILKREMDYACETKSVHWKYEKEWRQYISLDAEEIKEKASGKELFFVGFSEKLILREVIIR